MWNVNHVSYKFIVPVYHDQHKIISIYPSSPNKIAILYSVVYVTFGGVLNADSLFKFTKHL